MFGNRLGIRRSHDSSLTTIGILTENLPRRGFHINTGVYQYIKLENNEVRCKNLQNVRILKSYEGRLNMKILEIIHI